MSGSNNLDRGREGDHTDVEIPMLVADALAATSAVAPPDDLFGRVASISAQRRPAGDVVPLGADAADPVDAFLITATELRSLLRTLNDEDWNTPTTTAYGSVRDVVAHLAGIEDYCTRALSRDVAPDPLADFDHSACSASFAASMQGLGNADVGETWFAMAMSFADAFEHDIDPRLVDMHQLPVTIDGAFALRTFEVWAHTEDICAALGRPLPRLDGPRLACMSSRLVDAIRPFIVSNENPDASARIVLLGPGGGVADIGAPRDDGRDPSMRFVADVVDYCRVASRRLPIGDLDCVVEGDTALLDPFLTATAMFAKD